jgi:hypothetical protein
MKWNQASKGQQAQARRLTDRAWKAGINEATVSQVIQDLAGWQRRVESAEGR